MYYIPVKEMQDKHTKESTHETILTGSSPLELKINFSIEWQTLSSFIPSFFLLEHFFFRVFAVH